MTRDEYIAALADALNFLEEDTRAAALAFYTEMLDDRMEEGLAEEAAVEAMDSPDVIANRLKKEQTQDPASGGAQSPFSGNDPFAGIADQARMAMEKAMKATDQLLKNAGNMANMAMTKAADALQQTSQRIDEQVKKGMAGEYEQRIFTCPAEGIHHISLQARNIGLRMEQSPDDQIHLTYYTSEKDRYAVSLQDGVLSLTALDAAKGAQRFFSFNFNQFKALWRQGTPTVELLMPADTLCDLSASTSNASIHARNLSSLCHIFLRTSNSRITLEAIKCKQLEMETSNARLTLHNVESKSGLKGKTSNGRIEGEQVKAGAALQLATSNGSIRAAACTAEESLTLTASNGAIEVNDCRGQSISLRTSNGSIRGVLPGPLSRYAIDSGTSNGRNSLPQHQAGETPLSVHTSNGNIAIEIL